MKGISPLVAAVLLIGVTMTIAGILAFWVSGFMYERTKGFEEKAAMYEKCIGANFGIYSSTYDSVNKTLTILLENKAGIRLNLTEINIILLNGSIDIRPLNMILPRAGAWLPIKIENVDACEKYRIVTECTEPTIFREGTC
ncbi:MAG: type IV pilin [Candidatus Aenigmarchaeota archaeon]|nr:type IV pilin [Candidatus Aenigmarchaeota archaeon]